MLIDGLKFHQAGGPKLRLLKLMLLQADLYFKRDFNVN